MSRIRGGVYKDEGGQIEVTLVEISAFDVENNEPGEERPRSFVSVWVGEPTDSSEPGQVFLAPDAADDLANVLHNAARRARAADKRSYREAATT